MSCASSMISRRRACLLAMSAVTAVGSGAAGHEIEGPMAMVILGGLITSTLLNLLVLPTLALRYGRFEKSGAGFGREISQQG